MMFDFNSQELFSPDADSIDVAKQCWKWLLNPIDIANLNPGRATHIQRNFPEWYDQLDPEDNLMSEAMISQYVQINHGSEKPVRFKEDIEVTKTIGNYQFGFD